MNFSFGNQRNNLADKQPSVVDDALSQFVSDPDQAKRVAKKLFDLYDKDKNGILDSFEIGPIMVDTYKGMSKNFFPYREDIIGFQEILDSNGDGKVNYNDIEEFALRILAGIPNQIDASQLNPNQTNEEKNNQMLQMSEILENIAKRIFQQFDYEKSGFIDVRSVPDMIKETYKGINPNYLPSQQDINFWMNMLDQDRDGRVTLQEFINAVKQSLQNADILM